MLRLGFENIEVVNNPNESDLIFQSLFGIESQNLGVRNVVTFIGEPTLPTRNWGVTLGFKKNSEKEGHYYLPLHLLQFAWLDAESDQGNPELRIPISNVYRNRSFLGSRFKRILFSSVFNHDPSGNRFAVLRELERKKIPIYAYGKPFKNGGFSDYQKLELYNHSFFSMAFESTLLEGYQTEKIVHSYFGGSVPVSWGWLDSCINRDSIIELSNFRSPEELVDYLSEIAADESTYRKIYEQPLYTKNPTLDNVVLPILKAVARAQTL